MPRHDAFGTNGGKGRTLVTIRTQISASNHVPSTRRIMDARAENEKHERAIRGWQKWTSIGVNLSIARCSLVAVDTGDPMVNFPTRS